MQIRIVVPNHREPALGGIHADARLALRNWWADQGHKPLLAYVQQLRLILHKPWPTLAALASPAYDYPEPLDLASLFAQEEGVLHGYLLEGEQTGEKLKGLQDDHPTAKMMFQRALRFYERLLGALPQLTTELAASFRPTNWEQHLAMDCYLSQINPGNGAGSNFGPDTAELISICQGRMPESDDDFWSLRVGCRYDVCGFRYQLRTNIVDDKEDPSSTEDNDRLLQIAADLSRCPALARQILTVSALANLTAFAYVPRPFNIWWGYQGGTYGYVPFLKVIEQGS